jgi:hypothetical protein
MSEGATHLRICVVWVVDQIRYPTEAGKHGAVERFHAAGRGALAPRLVVVHPVFALASSGVVLHTME